jgi:hypothetical protein
MHDAFRFNSIGEGLVFIGVMSVFLSIALYYDYRRKQLKKEHKCLRSLISDIEKLTNHKL